MTYEPKFRLRVAALLFFAAFALHIGRISLHVAPSADEMLFGLTADSISTTGYDLTGRFMPLYFPMGGGGRGMWFQPLLFYTTVVVLKVLPFSEVAIRVPMAIVGTLDVALLYVVAALVFESAAAGTLAAVLLMLTPAHLLYASVALDYQAPVTFVLAWLACLLMHERTGRARWLLPAGLSLGLGLYTHVSAWFVMPVCAAVTCLALYRRRERTHGYALFAAGFLPALLLVVVYFATHPLMRAQMASRYEHDINRPAAGDFMSTFATVREAMDTVPRLVGYFGPRFLFLTGPLFAPWHIGVFTLALAGLIVAAAVRMARRPSLGLVMIVAACLLAPVPASGLGEREAVRRALPLLPFGILLAIAGLEHLRQCRGIERQLTMVLVWAAPVVLAIYGREHLFRSQAFIRALTVPLAVAGLAALVPPVDVARQWRLLAVAAVAAVAMVVEANAFIGPQGVIIAASMCVGALSAAALRTSASPLLEGWPLLVVVLLAVLASEFTIFYFDLALVPGIPHLRASAVRFAAALVVLAATGGAAAIAWRDVRRGAAPSAVLAVCVAALIAAYFSVDVFDDFRLRLLLLAALLAGVVWAAIRLGGLIRSPQGPWLVTAAGVVAVSVIQFGHVYRDSIVVAHDQGGLAAEAAWEAVVARAEAQEVPSICIVAGALPDPLYARFYLVKNRRKDLLPRLRDHFPDLPEAVDTVRALPRGSLVVAAVSARAEPTVNALVADGVIAGRDLITTADGTPMYWILRRA